jgi:UPF0176 protein
MKSFVGLHRRLRASSMITRCCSCAVLSALSISVPVTAFHRSKQPLWWPTSHHATILSTLPVRLHPRYRVYSLRISPWDDDASQSPGASTASAISSTTPLVGGSDAVLSQKPLPTDATHLQMLSFYHFEQISDVLQARNDCFEAIRHIPGVRGTIYVAKEGINAQMAVPPGDPLEALLEACATKLPVNPFLNQNPNLGDVVDIHTPTFNRLIVRARDFILRDGIDGPHGTASLDWTDAGNELAPEEWHRTLLQNNDSPILLLDCRNAYESQQGTFQGAIPLDTENFQDSWGALRDATKDVAVDTPIAIFCTGGIRCVKTGAFLKQTLGFENVLRLQHGIIGYQRYQRDSQMPDNESLWQGDNFLFDKRRKAIEGQEDGNTINPHEI